MARVIILSFHRANRSGCLEVAADDIFRDATGWLHRSSVLRLMSKARAEEATVVG